MTKANPPLVDEHKNVLTYVVMCSSGIYSDRVESACLVVPDELSAQQLVTHLEQIAAPVIAYEAAHGYSEEHWPEYLRLRDIARQQLHDFLPHLERQWELDDIISPPIDGDFKAWYIKVPYLKGFKLRVAPASELAAAPASSRPD